MKKNKIAILILMCSNVIGFAQNDGFLAEAYFLEDNTVFSKSINEYEYIDDNEIFITENNLKESKNQFTDNSVPIYPGCQKKEDLKKCFNDKMGKLIKNFDYNFSNAGKYNIRGIQKMFTIFTINESGEVGSVLIKASHVFLENEVRRLISKLPIMIPAHKDGVPIPFEYSFPLTINLEQ